MKEIFVDRPEPGAVFVRKPSPKPSFVIDPIVPAEGITLLYGPSKIGKTTLLWTMGESITTGGLFLGTFATQRASCLYLNFDMPKYFTHARWTRAGYVPSFDVSHVSHHVNLANLPLTSPGTYANLVAYGAPYDVIMLDSLYTITQGMKLTDDTTPSLILDALHTMYPNKAIILLHHARKQIMTERGYAQPSPEDFLGSQLWMAGIQSQLQMFHRPNNMAHLRSNGAHLGVMDEGIEVYVDEGACQVVKWDGTSAGKQVFALQQAEAICKGRDPNYVFKTTDEKIKELIPQLNKLGYPRVKQVHTIKNWIARCKYSWLT